MLKQYTEQEIINMANECFPRCNGCDRCEPVPGRYSISPEPTYVYGPEPKKLFDYVNFCYYACKLPIATERYCVFFGSKENADNAKVDLFLSLTSNNVKRR